MTTPRAPEYTEIPVMYRCASNYKTYGAYMAAGAITDEQRERLKLTLSPEVDGGFIPTQIGLEHLAVAAGLSIDDEQDVNWHELDVTEIAVVPTLDPAVTYVGTVEEFVQRMEAVTEWVGGWDTP